MEALFLLKFSLLLLMLNYKEIKANPSENLVIANEASDPVSKGESKVDERISKLETEVAHLKTKGDGDEREINQLVSRIERLEATFNVAKECNCNDEPLRRLKRPASLLPIESLQRGESDFVEGENEERRFYGPPTNCNDLVKLGYTLNGYYLVKGKQGGVGKIQVVLCQFRVPEKQSDYLETPIGNVELKTKSVHFYVQRNTPFWEIGIIPFHLDRLNVGGAMNLSSGIFTVPLNGIYHFQFSGVKVWHVEEMYVILRLNGLDVARAFTTNYGIYGSGSLSASLKLKAGDRVNLWNARGELHDNEDERFTQFTGWLEEEDFILA